MSALECGICLLQYNEEERTPRMLTSCGHTVCQQCAIRLSGANYWVVCPFDRKVTKLNSEGVNGLPKNFALLDLSRKANQEQEKISETKMNVPCFEDPSHEAVVYCQQCEMDFCDLCFASVHKSKALSSHQKINISEKPIKLPKCPRHPHKTAEFFCTDPCCTIPTKILCQTCVMLDQHKSHKYDCLMEKLIENEQYLKNTVKGQKVMQEWGEMSAKLANQVLASYDVTGEEFKEAVQSISDQFDTKKKEAICELTQFANEKKEEKMEWKKRTEKKNSKMKELGKLIETLKITKDLQINDKIDDWITREVPNTNPNPDSKNEPRSLKDYEFIVPDIKLQVKEKPDVSLQPILDKFWTDVKLKYPEFFDD